VKDTKEMLVMPDFVVKDTIQNGEKLN
jgi:hypothetical protein